MRRAEGRFLLFGEDMTPRSWGQVCGVTSLGNREYFLRYSLVMGNRTHGAEEGYAEIRELTRILKVSRRTSDAVPSLACSQWAGTTVESRLAPTGT